MSVSKKDTEPNENGIQDDRHPKGNLKWARMGAVCEYDVTFSKKEGAHRVGSIDVDWQLELNPISKLCPCKGDFTIIITL